jgi:hypothetical protein
MSNNLYVKEYKMIAKEKAEELVNRMMDGFIFIFNKEISKKHALIACDEVLGYMGADRGTEFWQEVKQEIEKL